ncbi:MAG: hypothetical protein M1814_006640 [Vezdaea aestivalis]|nr:MAG: hypothetical protein M1814_006640 [Vezdaea aestivalis]
MAEANSELMKSPFDRLPLEIIHQIVGLLPLARDVTNLSQSCAWLNKAVENGGWDFFTNNRFPSLGVLALTAKGTPRARSFGKDAAKSLTAISRSWDRRAFIQRELGRPLAFSESERRGKMLQGHCIDSYLEFTGGDWASQREVLVMGVGSGWTMRVRLPGSSVSDQGLSRRIHWYSSRRVKGSSQEHSNSNILSINLLRPSQRICTAPDREELICPTQDGGSRHLVLSLETAEVEEELLNVRNQQDIYQYRRNDESVLSGSKFAWSTALSKDSAPLLSEVSAEKGIAIFKVPDERLPKPDPGPPRVITPSVVIGKSEDFVLDRSTYATQTWTVSWLQNGLLATGSGPGPEPLHVFDIYGPMPTIPLRAFPCPQDDSDPSTPAGNSARTSSVFAIAVLPPEFTGAGCNGNVFLSGWWDGSIR